MSRGSGKRFALPLFFCLPGARSPRPFGRHLGARFRPRGRGAAARPLPRPARAWPRLTEPEDIQLVDYNGNGAGTGYRPPNELPIHAGVLSAPPDVDVVVHAHPPPVVAADLAGIRLRPILGAFDIPGAHLTAGGIPVFARAVLFRTPELAAEMVASMAARPVVVLRGHGLTRTGGTVAEACCAR